MINAVIVSFALCLRSESIFNAPNRQTNKQTNKQTNNQTNMNSVGTHLCTTTCFVKSVFETIRTVRQGVTLDPLVGVLSTLGGDASDGCRTPKINLQPLPTVTLSGAPGPTMIESSVPGGEIGVIVRGSGHVTVTDSLIFKTNWYRAAT